MAEPASHPGDPHRPNAPRHEHEGRTQPHDPPRDKHEEIARQVLLGELSPMRYGRRFFRLLPSAPRCKLCNSPFSAPLGPLMRLVGKAPWPANPKYCSACFTGLTRYHAGAEIPCSVLFADVRGSTALAEQLRPTEFRDRMDRFFAVATKVLVDHDAIVDKYVGDEVMAIFIPALSGADHAADAVEAGRALLGATGHDGGPPWVPIGAGVNTGIAFVGAVGAGDKTELTAMGDTVNVAARLAAAAGTGELLVTTTTVEAAGASLTGLERRRLELKGKTGMTDVVVLGPA